MAAHLRVLLFITGLTGIYSMTTVSEVSVTTGASIVIPCLYDSQYINNVKALCKGYYWTYCSFKVKTNQQNSAKFSISDDKRRRIFTVTINHLTTEDTDYWCVVEIARGGYVRKYFHLAVTTGIPSLYVAQQEMTGFIGDDMTISCHYRNSGGVNWCKLGGSCVTSSSGSIHGTKVTIIRRVPGVFTVTMSGLKMESSGWYYCVKGDLQMPVHVTVTVKPTTAADSFSSLSPTPNPISGTGDGPNGTIKNGQSRASFLLKSLLIPLGLLVLIVVVALFIWCLLKRHKQTKAESSATTTADGEVTYSTVKHKRKAPRQAEEVAEYCNVGLKKKSSGQMSYPANDVDVMYSSVVTVKKKNVKRVKAEDKDVTYSTLG
ncbi:uncharacterized protein LOC121955057 isoform X2 [Plectropomus leopardus]|uniref:uncharacterized protein LOC121955057 isoform X2 n=1 Tax=Plectropomus leopardus TaxID=160734 RepID=UPI001C4B48A9|nr:uncharacterized protein LOC121955057 isoform X2 [Plectropomus leopardus]